MMLNNQIASSVTKHAVMPTQNLSIASIWLSEVIRDGVIINSSISKNLVTNEGLNALLNIMFHGSTQITTWYIALFSNNHTPAAGNTYATPGYTEYTTYDEATRQAFVEAAASGQAITNIASRAEFTISSGGGATVYGAALVGGGTGATTKGDTAGGGTLLCVSQFTDGAKTGLQAGDILRITINLAASVPA